MDEEGNRILLNLISEFYDVRRDALEIGCGNGKMLKEIAEKFTLYIDCLDPYSFAADKSFKTIKLPAGEIRKLNKRYDIIYSIRSFHHIERQFDFIEGLKDSLAFNGVFVLVDWKKGFDTGIPERYFDMDTIVDIFQNAGFDILSKGEGKSVFYIAVKFPFCYVVFPIKDGKTASLSDNGIVYKAVNIKTEEVRDIKNIENFPVIVTSRFGEKERLLNDKGVKIYYDRGGIKKSIEFIRDIEKRERCFWQSSCPVYFRYKRNEIPSFWVDNYCFVGNKECVRYQMEERGEYHSDYMLPDGKIEK